MSDIKRELILNVADEIVKYLDEKHAIDIELYDVVEIINLNIGWVFNTIEDELMGNVRKNKRGRYE